MCRPLGVTRSGYYRHLNKARKLMKEAGVLVKRRKKFKVTTDSHHAKPLVDNILNRDFVPKGRNQAYAQDITYIWTQEGCLYLATVIDLYSQRVVGWSMGSRSLRSLHRLEPHLGFERLS
jgi:transposase InsO family protein